MIVRFSSTSTVPSCSRSGISSAIGPCIVDR
jgi:hypothetical protein